MSGQAGAALDARLRLARGAFALDLELHLADGEILALLGPNGSGKSTVLDLLAGLLAPDFGTVTLGTEILTAPGIRVPPEKRGIGLLGQEPLLFPHLGARGNVAFPLRASGASTADAARTADRWLGRVGLAGLGERKPAALSGGQQQRVALARALAARPRLLLLDEPLAALDAETAPAMRQLIGEQLSATGTGAIVVSHDVVDAVVLADRVAILENGTIIDEGPPVPVLEAPKNQFVAALAGVNLVLGRALGGAVLAPDGRVFQVRPADASGLVEGEAAAAVFRPSGVAVHLERPQSAGPQHASSHHTPSHHTNQHGPVQHRPVQHRAVPRNIWAATVTALEPGSGGVRVRTSGSPEVTVEITPAVVAELGLQIGSTVWLSLKVTEVSAHRR